MSKLFVFTAVLLGFVMTASAGTIYTYTGNNFTESSGSNGATSSNFISFSFEVLTPILGNLLGDPTVAPISWTMTDGVSFLSSQNKNDALNLNLYTDAGGNIVDWAIQAIEGPSSLWIITSNPIYNCCPGPFDQSAIFGNGQFMAPTALARNAEIPGSWSVSSDVAAPEPATWMMLVSAFMALWGWRQISCRFVSAMAKPQISSARPPQAE